MQPSKCRLQRLESLNRRPTTLFIDIQRIILSHSPLRTKCRRDSLPGIHHLIRVLLPEHHGCIVTLPDAAITAPCTAGRGFRWRIAQLHSKLRSPQLHATNRVSRDFKRIDDVSFIHCKILSVFRKLVRPEQSDEVFLLEVFQLRVDQMSANQMRCVQRRLLPHDLKRLYRFGRGSLGSQALNQRTQRYASQCPQQIPIACAQPSNGRAGAHST